MSADPPQLLAKPDYITIVHSAPAIIDVLANDISPNGTPTIVSLTQGTKGVASIVDNKVAYTAFGVGTDVLYYAINNGYNQASSLLQLTVIPSASDLYAKYQTDVSAADQVYTEDVLAAAATRQIDIDGARMEAGSAAAQLYANYQGTVSQATATYGTVVANAEADYQSAVASADATHQADTDAALAIYDAAMTTAQTAYVNAEAAAEQAFQIRVLAADAACAAAVAPYQAAFEQAVVDAQNAQSALASAEAALSATTASAAADRDASQAAALVTPQRLRKPIRSMPRHSLPPR